MQALYELFYHLIHIDVYLLSFISAHGLWAYVVVFAVIFCETGLIVTPFLPGDSLLFALGSIAAQESTPLNVAVLFFLLVVASALGNQLSYIVGRFIGPKVFSANHSWLLNKKYLEEAHIFYETHGGKTIIFARFIPIVRTFAPFVAGVGSMNRQAFVLYNLSSAILWIGSLLGLGYFGGSLPIIKEHFSAVIYGIVAFSLIPPLFAFLKRYRRI